MMTVTRALAVCAVLASHAMAQDCATCSTRVVYDPLVGDLCTNMQDAYDSTTACITKCDKGGPPCSAMHVLSSPNGCKDLTCQGQPVVDTFFDEDDICGRRCGRLSTRGAKFGDYDSCKATQAIVDSVYKCYEELCDTARAQQFCESDWHRPAGCVERGELTCGGGAPPAPAPPPMSCLEECTDDIAFSWVGGFCQSIAAYFGKLKACHDKCGLADQFACPTLGGFCDLDCPDGNGPIIRSAKLYDGPQEGDAEAASFSPVAAGGIAGGAVLMGAAVGLAVVKQRRRNSAANTAAVATPAQDMPEL